MRRTAASLALRASPTRATLIRGSCIFGWALALAALLPAAAAGLPPDDTAFAYPGQFPPPGAAILTGGWGEPPPASEPSYGQAFTPNAPPGNGVSGPPPPAEKPENKEEDKEKKEKEDKEKEEKDKKEEEGKEKEEKEKAYERFNVYGQATVISQFHGPFPAAYTGPNSLDPNREFDTSATTTLFVGARLWQGAEMYFNPEVAGGNGFSNVTGIAGFPNGDITRVSEVAASPYLARWYMTQTIGLGGEQEKVESGPNQLAGTRDVDRITIALGKMAATDWIDNNRYSHDPRSQFMNWSLMYNGAWDYPANVRGYDYGGLIEFNFPKMAFRYELFGEPSVANGAWIDGNFGQAHGQAWELENRYTICGHPGKMRWMYYLNRAHMGSYGEALALSPTNPEVTQTREYRQKYGFGVNLEQELTADLGGFFRFGWDSGDTETWAFTAIDRTVAMGLVLKGRAWCRSQDEVGLAWVINGLAPIHRTYLAAGGLDFDIGDGRLDYGQEVSMETYYRYELKKKQIWLSPDLQVVENPAYNRARGPVTVGTVRFHAEF